jgi:hypothetical protein
VRVTVAAIEATLELWSLLRRDDALEMLSDPNGVLVVDEAVLRCWAAVNRIYRQKSAIVSDRGFAFQVSRCQHAFIDLASHPFKAWANHPRV